MKQPASRKKILVIRNDKIGDFMLAWPSFALLKKQYPEAEITALVPEYTAELAELCEWIDHVLIDARKTSFIRDVLYLLKNIKEKKFDVSICLYSQTRTALAVWLAGIQRRIGPATKIAQIFLNLRLRQKRSESIKPEYEYNLDLIKYYIHLSNNETVKTPSAPYLQFPKDEIKALKNKIVASYKIPSNNKIIIIHPGTGGSAINLSIDQYSTLAKKLAKSHDLFFIITAGPGELRQAGALSRKLEGTPHGVYESKSGIVDFCKFINTCDLFISGSTGPLHIAGALNIQTAAFYPSKKSATSLRWETLNSPEKRLAFSNTDTNTSNDLAIDHECVAQSIIERILN